MTDFTAEMREFIARCQFAVVATLNDDGCPHTSLVWIKLDGEAVVFSTTAGRRKGRNIIRDHRVCFTVFDPEQPYRTVDIAGTAEVIEDPENLLPRELSLRYLGKEPEPESTQVRRLTVRVTPQRVTTFSG